MKKLLIAMTAAAVGTCAWAEGVTLLDQNFDSAPTGWTVADDGKVSAVADPWSYSGENGAVGDGELTLADGKLTLNTGSKVLTGSFASDKNPVAIGADGLYFKSTVTFKDPSDTLPTLGAQDKFALVVLDNLESVEAGLATENTTNLYVIANHGVDGKRAYQLSPAEGLVDLTETWLSTPKTITVKAYRDVMAGANARAGFLVKVGDYVCKVYMSYKITEDNVIDFVNGFTDAAADKTTAAGYLGYADTDIDGSVRLRYKNQELMLSMVTDDTLTSVDFQGQGVIDDVSLATTGADFGPDATVITFIGYDAEKIASITVGGAEAVDGVYTITGSETAEEGKVAIVVTVNEGYVLKGEGWTKNGLTYTYVGYTLPNASAAITLNVFAPAAYVGEEAYETFAEALAAAVTAGGKIQLAGAITLESEPIQIESDVTIDLAGKTIEVAGDFPAIYNAANTLTIEDSVGGGKVNGAVTGDGTFVITGGGFLASANTADDKFTLEGSVANGYEVSGPTDGYWVVQAPTTYAVTYTAENATITKDDVAFTSGTELQNGTYTFKVEAAEGYKVDSVTVGDVAASVAADGTFSVTVDGAAVAIVVTTSLKQFEVTLSLTGATVSGVEEKKYDYGSTVSFTVAAAEGYEAPFTVKAGEADLEATEGTYTFTVNAAVTITVEATKKAGPTIPGEQGSVSKPDENGNVTVTPAEGVTEITISGTVTGTVSVPSSIEKVSGVEFGKLVITYTDEKGVTSVITDAFKSGENGEIVLNETAVVNGVPVKPVMAEQTALPEGMTAPLEVGTDVAVGVKTIPGLKYQLIRSDAPNGTFSDVTGASATGTGAPVKLSDGQKPDGKAFYKIKVMPR